MSDDESNNIEPKTDFPLPDPFIDDGGVPLVEFLRCMTGRSLADKREKLRLCVTDVLRTRYPGATDSDARATFGRLEREGIRTPDEWRALADQYQAWRQRRKSAQARYNRVGDTE